MSGRCGAKLRRSDPPRYCRRLPITDSKRCALHGGRSLRGVASPGFKHGYATKDYGIVLTAKAREVYQATLDDPDILSLRREIALLRSWLIDLVGDSRAGEGGSWAAVTAAWNDFEAASRMANQAGQIEALGRVREQIRAGTAVEANRREALRLSAQLEKLTRSERDREVELFQMITAEEALGYMRAMSLSVRETLLRYVQDAEVRTAVLTTVAQRFAQLAGGRSTASLSAGDRFISQAVHPKADE
jgi:hypothetical protein